MITEVRLPSGELFEQCTSGETFPLSVGPRRVTNVLCSDGSRRVAHLSEKGADTFFSIPARVYVKGKTVSGYVTRETLQGFSTETPGDCAAWKFVAYTYGKNANLLPRGAFRAPTDQPEAKP